MLRIIVFLVCFLKLYVSYYVCMCIGNVLGGHKLSIVGRVKRGKYKTTSACCPQFKQGEREREEERGKRERKREKDKRIDGVIYPWKVGFRVILYLLLYKISYITFSTMIIITFILRKILSYV